MAQEEVLHAYRHLYRAALRAVCYSQPASSVARDQLRRAFRDKTNTFNRNTIRRTVWFLNNAARERGTEHKIVKNLLFTKFWKERGNYRTWRHLVDSNQIRKKEDPVKATAYAHYERTISMLNRTMGLCLPLS
ncbi:hypothetical protein KVR01_009871 [Diaporthe batatas]|uniref:uncharacterized protein n=1 Tax=Diaporthe batatas TaxID=748121 RepID=UPI001D05BBE9|nr:uncharacterized protein KVR01_009871 [Diaporthe batatas]KAG8160335.1 hypothetical protein KVR01_009871 [Diaporthe batatas]